LAALSDKYQREGWKFWEEDLEFILAKTEIIDLTTEIAIKAGKTKKEMRKSHLNFGLVDARIDLLRNNKERTNYLLNPTSDSTALQVIIP
jgi:hypothetical protein